MRLVDQADKRFHFNHIWYNRSVYLRSLFLFKFSFMSLSFFVKILTILFSVLVFFWQIIIYIFAVKLMPLVSKYWAPFLISSRSSSTTFLMSSRSSSTTFSRTWITPFDAETSVVKTLEPSIFSRSERKQSIILERITSWGHLK